MKQILLVIFGLLGLILGYFYLRHPLGEKVIIGGHTIQVEVAVTNSQKEKGLGGRESLAPDRGMLFVYPNRDRYGFWMKDMRFPLDYIWIDGTTIVDLSQHVPAPKTAGEPPIELSPKVPVDKVLEVNAGVIEKLGIKIGDAVKFSD